MTPLSVDRNEWPLDSMGLHCDVTKKVREDFNSPPREGAYVHGLYMEGARWDTQVQFYFAYTTHAEFENKLTSN